MNWALKNRSTLNKQGNYTHRANSKLQNGEQQYFLNLRPKKMERLKVRTDGQLNIIVIGRKHLEFDYFIIPFSTVSHLLTKETLDPRKRWLINIIRDEFTLFRGGVPGESVNVSNCYRANHPADYE